MRVSSPRSSVSSEMDGERFGEGHAASEGVGVLPGSRRDSQEPARHENANTHSMQPGQPDRGNYNVASVHTARADRRTSEAASHSLSRFADRSHPATKGTASGKPPLAQRKAPARQPGSGATAQTADRQVGIARGSSSPILLELGEADAPPRVKGFEPLKGEGEKWFDSRYTEDRTYAIRRWIEVNIEESFAEPLVDALRDGVRLCRLINKFSRALHLPERAAVVEDPCSKDAIYENVHRYIRIGLKEGELFKAEDLVDSKDFDRVLGHLRSLQAVVTAKVLAQLSGRQSRFRRRNVGSLASSNSSTGMRVSRSFPSLLALGSPDKDTRAEESPRQERANTLSSSDRQPWSPAAADEPPRTLSNASDISWQWRVLADEDAASDDGQRGGSEARTAGAKSRKNALVQLALQNAVFGPTESHSPTTDVAASGGEQGKGSAGPITRAYSSSASTGLMTSGHAWGVSPAASSVGFSQRDEGAALTSAKATAAHSQGNSVDEYKEKAASAGIDSRSHQRWKSVLEEYESKRRRVRALERTTFSPVHRGQGATAYNTWRLEEDLREMIRRENDHYGPLPDDLHGEFWLLISGARQAMENYPGYYDSLFRPVRTEDELGFRQEIIDQIDTDLPRTLVCSGGKRSEEDGALFVAMRRVLVAYSRHNAQLGYCQGLNFLVARLLRVVGEEEAFWLLVKMIMLVPSDYYTSMLGVVVDQHVFADLVELEVPDVARHLEELGGTGLELALACTEWFLTLFSSPFKEEVTYHIWDELLAFGDETLFKVGLALVKAWQERLLACSTYSEALSFVNTMALNDIDALELMRLARTLTKVDSAILEEFRSQHRLIVSASFSGGEPGESSDRGSSSHSFSKGEGFVAAVQSMKHGWQRNRRSAGATHREPSRGDAEIGYNYAVYYDGSSPTLVENYILAAPTENEAPSNSEFSTSIEVRRTTQFSAPDQYEQVPRCRRHQGNGSGLARDMHAGRADAAWIENVRRRTGQTDSSGSPRASRGELGLTSSTRAAAERQSRRSQNNDEDDEGDRGETAAGKNKGDDMRNNSLRERWREPRAGDSQSWRGAVSSSTGQDREKRAHRPRGGRHEVSTHMHQSPPGGHHRPAFLQEWIQKKKSAHHGGRKDAAWREKLLEKRQLQLQRHQEKIKSKSQSARTIRSLPDYPSTIPDSALGAQQPVTFPRETVPPDTSLDYNSMPTSRSWREGKAMRGLRSRRRRTKEEKQAEIELKVIETYPPVEKNESDLDPNALPKSDDLQASARAGVDELVEQEESPPAGLGAATRRREQTFEEAERLSHRAASEDGTYQATDVGADASGARAPQSPVCSPYGNDVLLDRQQVIAYLQRTAVELESMTMQQQS